MYDELVGNYLDDFIRLSLQTQVVWAKKIHFFWLVPGIELAKADIPF